MSRDSIYDSIFKTMTQKMPHLLVPLVNYVFGTNYPEGTPVVRMGEEYEDKVKKRIADSVFRIEGGIFHIECQSQWDPNMAMRMDRYDREIAHEEAEARRECHWLKLPQPCVIFLRNARSMPPSLSIEVEEPDGEISRHRTSALWVQQIPLDEMLENQLYILLPFWLMRYEGIFDKAAADSALERQLLEECRVLQARFAKALENGASPQALDGDAEGSSTFQRRMTELIIKVSDHLLRDYGPLQREVREAMGVKILKFADERYAEERREADERYAEERREADKRYAEREQKAREESHRQGVEQERERVAESLRSRGFDESTIEEVLSFNPKDDGDIEEGHSAQQA